MASHGGYDEAVQHGTQVHVLLQVTLDILKHALRNVETLHIHHNLSENLCLGFFLVERPFIFSGRRLRPGAATGIVADFRLGGHEAVLGADCVVHFSDSFEDHAAEFTLAGNIRPANASESLDCKLCAFFWQFWDGE